MSYDDHLGIVLDRLEHDDLIDMATGPLRMSSRSVESCSSDEIRIMCSKRLRRAAGHSAVNLLREEHGLPYDKIVGSVARELRIKDSTGDVLMLEHLILAKFTTEAWNSMSSRQRRLVEDDIGAEMTKSGVIQAGQAASRLRKVIPVLLKTSCRTQALSTVSVAAVSAGPIVTTFGSVMGWNVLQTIIFRAVLSRAGMLAAARATLGYGLAGTAMSAAAWVGPIGWGVTGLWLAHQLAKPSLRITGPAVAFVALKRIELLS
jgi:uncharacterized protein YaaW (UPF0174 family)